MATTNTKKTTTPKKDTKVENTDMKELMEQMKKLMEQNEALKSEVDNIKQATPHYVSAAPQTVDREISFVSLFPGILNLSTQGLGQGQLYTFTEFGQVHLIPYSEAKLILKNQAHLAKEGYFYVDDAELVKNSQLATAYKTILDQKSFESLFETSPAAFSKIFKGIPEAQRESFADMIVLKLYNGEKIDMNIVQEVNLATKRDLVTEATGDKAIFTSEPKK